MNRFLIPMVCFLLICSMDAARCEALANSDNKVNKNAKSAVVNEEFIFDHAPFPSCHASTIEESKQGLIVAWFGGTHEHHPDVGIWVSIRDQSGNWSTPKEVANGKVASSESSSVPTWNPVLFQPENRDRKKRKAPLYLFYKVGKSPEEWFGKYTTSIDGGLHWTTPKDLPEGIVGPSKNKPIELDNGDWLIPSSTETKQTPSNWQVHFERTKDGGKTWTKTQPINDGISIQAIQPSIIKLGPKKILALARTRQNSVYESTSEDNGYTWKPLTIGSLPNNNSGLDAVRLKNGRYLLVYNHSTTGGQWTGPRTPLNLAISDDGHIWKSAIILENTGGEFSYPAIIQSKDGLVHITYTWNKQKIKHVTVDPVYL